MIPLEFIDRLQQIVPNDKMVLVQDSFNTPDPLIIRINTLRAQASDVQAILSAQGMTLLPVPFCSQAYEVQQVAREVLTAHPFVLNGSIYLQALSSLIPAIVLAPQPGERVLDLCAAPGSKTTQMAAMMEGRGEIVAVEAVRGRFFKLRLVCTLLNAGIVRCICADGRRFKYKELFDRILVDAPCSSEGRFKSFNSESFAYWSSRKIKETSQKQKGLLMSAGRLLKAGGRMVYSTCSFAPEENEGVVSWFLRKTEGQFTLENIDLANVPGYPCLSSWAKKTYPSDINRCLRVLPDNRFTGFFVASFIKSP